MLVTIIEDDGEKAEQLKDVVSVAFPKAQIEVFGSFNKGLRAVRALCPDILLLDMTLPTFDRQPGVREGRSRPIGGYEILRKLSLSRLAPMTIVVSQFETFGDGPDQLNFQGMSAKCAAEFPEMYRGAVKFELAGSAWRHELSAVLGGLFH